MLDIGLLIGTAICINLLYKYINDIPIGRPHYRPPTPDMGWDRVIGSTSTVGILVAIAAAFIASPLRATPGMSAFYIRAQRKNGARIGFFRAFFWILTAFLPLLSANYLILIGVAMEIPLIHVGLLNLFSLMILLQVLWFVPVLSDKEKRSIPDRIWGVRVHYYDHEPGGMKLLKKIFHAPFLIFLLVLMGGVGGWATLNLLDRPLNPRIERLQEMAPENPVNLRATWKNQSSFEIAMKLADFRCASRHIRFHGYAPCQDRAAIRDILSNNQSLIDNYTATFFGRAAHSNPPYLTEESVALTDLILADMILRIEDPNSTPDSRKAVIKNWLLMANSWKDNLFSDGFLFGKSRVLIHYNHVLHALPVLLDAAADETEDLAHEIEQALAPAAFDQSVIDNILAHEYALYERILNRSQVDYLPFIQPNTTRNYFVAAIDVADTLFAEDTLLRHQRNTIKPLQDLHSWRAVYNPLGLFFRDYALDSFTGATPVIGTFHHNNALKTMLRIGWAAHRLGIPPENMGMFVNALPDEKRMVMKSQPVLWDGQARTLYYQLPGMAGFRRELRL